MSGDTGVIQVKVFIANSELKEHFKLNNIMNFVGLWEGVFFLVFIM